MTPPQLMKMRSLKMTIIDFCRDRLHQRPCNGPRGLEIKMPRPKSDLTSVAVTVSARLIPAHFAEWKRLGGVNWLRQQLRESIQKQKEQK